MVGKRTSIAAVVALAVSNAVLAAPVILSSAVTGPTKLTITGTGLSGGTTVVTLGSSSPLQVLTQSATQLEVALPASLSAGSYVLNVRVGTGAAQIDKSVVTIGAVGPAGAMGTAGPAGPGALRVVTATGETTVGSYNSETMDLDFSVLLGRPLYAWLTVTSSEYAVRIPLQSWKELAATGVPEEQVGVNRHLIAYFASTDCSGDPIEADVFYAGAGTGGQTIPGLTTVMYAPVTGSANVRFLRATRLNGNTRDSESTAKFDPVLKTFVCYTEHQSRGPYWMPTGPALFDVMSLPPEPWKLK